jgi:hypothetical protein
MIKWFKRMRIRSLRKRMNELRRYKIVKDYKTDRILVMSRYIVFMSLIFQLLGRLFPNNKDVNNIITFGLFIVIAIFFKDIYIFSFVFKYERSIKEINDKIKKLSY